MPMSNIEELINTQDSVEIIRDQIAAILAIELDGQQDLAKLADEDPAEWGIDVYKERIRPFESNSDENGEAIGDFPLINVSFDNDVFDPRGGNVVEKQKCKGTFYIDCYAHVNSYTDSSGDFQTGDSATSMDSDRIARIARRILQAGIYTYLGLQGTVLSRKILRREKFIPSDREGKYFENVIATRITMEVEYYESSPQTQGTDLDLLIWDCEIGVDGLVSIDSSFDYTT